MSLAQGIENKSLMRNVTRVLSIIIVIGSLAAFGWVARGAFQSTENFANVRWTPFVAAIALQFVMLFVLMFLWERLLGYLWQPARDDEQNLAKSGLYTAYSRSWLARYIPGRIWALGGRALLANKVGVPVDAVARSMVFEVLFTYGIVTILGGALLLWIKVHSTLGLVLFVTGIVAFGASVLIAQRILSSSANTEGNGLWHKLLRRSSKLLIGQSQLTLPNTVWGILVYGFYSAMQLGFIVLIAASFADMNLERAVVIAGAWGISVTLGWVSFLAPVGLGVRDGLAFYLFGQVLDAPTASLIVASSRVVMIAADLVFVGAVELFAVGLNMKLARVFNASKV